MLSLRFVFLAVMLTACAASNGPAEEEPWRLELTSSGGITGRGAGTFTLDSKGAYVVETPNGKRCTFEAPADALRIVAAAREKQWAESYEPENACCDRYEWTLTLERGGGKRTTRWVEEPKPMPKDLAAIVKRLADLRAELVCR